MMSFVGILEKSEQIVSSKYQNELMSAYWSLAHLHNELHYLAYTRKYADRYQHSPKTKQLAGCASAQAHA